MPATSPSGVKARSVAAGRVGVVERSSGCGELVMEGANVRVSRRVASVALTEERAFSYSASSLIRRRMVETSGVG